MIGSKWRQKVWGGGAHVAFYVVVCQRQLRTTKSSLLSHSRTQTFCKICTNIVAIKALLVHSSTLKAITNEVTMMQYNMCGKDDVYRKGKREFDHDMSMSWKMVFNEWQTCWCTELLPVMIPVDTNLCEALLYDDGWYMLGVLAVLLWLTRIPSLPVHVLIMASARVAGLSMPALLLVMVPADTNLCEGSIYIGDDNLWFVSTGM